MPNWVANRVVIVGSDDAIKRVVEFVKGDESVFDFNKIVPMPETYEKYDTTNHPDGKGLTVGKTIGIFDETVVTEELIEEYKQATAEQMEKYGVVGWYDWHRKFWGTKWNACDAFYDGNSGFLFDTAWSAPIAALKALSRRFPDVEIEFAYADEDCSYNTGEGSIKDGRVDANYYGGNSHDGWRLYFDLHPGMEDEMHRDETGQWVWNDD